MRKVVTLMAETKLDKYGYRLVIGSFVGPFIQVGMFIAICGRADVLGPWLYLPIGLIGLGVGSTIVARVNPTLSNVRGRWKQNKGTKRWDRAILPFFGLLGFYAVPAIAAIDIKYRLAPSPPVALPVAAAVVFLIASVLLYWAMITNRHFEVTVRIQEERDHKVVSHGPYRFVRHPGYVGAIIWGPSSGLIFGSYWAVVPGLISAGILVLRTALEDRTLQRELPGYAEYAQRTRYRLIPGLW